MTAIARFADLISDSNLQIPPEALARSRDALVDTLACMYAGADQAVTQRSAAAVQGWASGSCRVFGTGHRLSPPFAALVNGASAHAFDYDDFDEPANAHPSAVIFPALLALAAERETRGLEILEAHVIGVEVMQRLGEAMNMDHYRRGWLSTLTLGTLGAAAACARFNRFDHATASAALSLAASMASGLTNQGGYLAKQMNPGFAAKNGVMAAALAAAGIDASDQVIDGPISLARSMGRYDAEKFDRALAKIANPWSILEYGLIMKAYPTCGYTHRLVDAAIDLHTRLPQPIERIRSIELSVPDYYLDLLVYPRPVTPAEAMFSAEYNVAAALCRGRFGLDELEPEAIADPELSHIVGLSRVDARTPRDSDIVYDADDPDTVEIVFADDQRIDSRVGLPTGTRHKPMDEARRHAKFDRCLRDHETPAVREALWGQLGQIERALSLGFLLDG